MEDKDILMLEALGYTFSDSGAIIDKDGNYTSSVEHNGRVVESPASIEEYQSELAEKSYLKNINFSPSTDSNDPERVQAKKAIALEEIKNFDKNPMYTNLPTDVEGSVYEDAYNDYRAEKEANGEFVHDTYQSFVEESNKGVYNDLDTDEERQSLKETEKEISRIQSIDPDVDSALEFATDESKGFVVNNIGGVPSILAVPTEDSNIIEKATFAATDFLNDAISGIMSTFTPTGTGMKDEKLQEKYIELQDKRKELLKPVAAKRLNEVNTYLDTYNNEIDSFYEELGKTSLGSDERKQLFEEKEKTIEKLQYLKGKLEKNKNNLEDFINDGQFDTNIFSMNNAEDWGSAGIIDAVSSVMYNAGLRKKLDNGEELDAGDIAIAKYSELEQNINQGQFKQNFLHDVTGGTNESLKYLGGGMLGRAAGKAGSRALVRMIGNTRVGRGIGTTASITAQTVLHPDSYVNAADQYAGAFQVTETEDGQVIVEGGQRLYESQKRENALMLSDIETQLETETDEVKKEKLLSAQKQIKRFDESLAKPVSGLQSLAYGYGETLKETLAENYGGKLFNVIGGKQVQSVLGRALNKIPGAKNLNRMSSRGKDFINSKLGSVPGQKVIGSTTEEIFEEMLVQATPSVGQSWDEYVDQASELGSLDFYTKVAAQTLLMQKTMALGNTPAKIKTYLNKDTRQQRKDMKELYKQLGSKHISQEDFNQAMMKVGGGNFSIQEYNNEIKAMKEAGDIVGANEIERTKILKQALHAEKSGMMGQFIKTMTKAKYNKNLSPETIMNIETLLPQLKELDDTPYINRTEIINLKSKKTFAEKSISEINNRINDLSSVELNEEFDKIKENLQTNIDLDNFMDNNEALTYLQDNFDSLSEDMQQLVLMKKQRYDSDKSLNKLNDEIKKKTSFEHQTALDLQQDYMKYIETTNKQMFGGKMTVDQFDKLIENKSIKKRARSINQTDIDRIHEATRVELQRQKNNKTTKTAKAAKTTTEPTPDTDNNPSPDVTTEPTPPTPRQNNTVSVLQNVAQQQTPDPDIDFSNDVVDQTLDFLPATEDTVNDLSQWGETFKEEENKAPTFTDFFNDAVEQVGKKGITKQTLETLGDAFEKAGLGKSNWEQVYKDNYVDRKKIALNAINNAINDNNEESNEASTVENKKTVEVEQAEQQPVATVNPITSQPIRLTPVSGKTNVISAKANYKGVNYNDKTVETEDGTIILTKENKDKIPVINDESIINVRELLDPNKNNPGDTWDAEMLPQEEWSTIPVSNGENRSFTNFQAWVNNNKPEGMTLEEFMKTDEFIGKVPLVYKSSNGEIVSVIPDTDWYNTFNIKDPNKKAGDVQDLDNPTESHKAVIKKGKDNTLELRKSIMSGDVSKVEILTKSGSPVDFYPVGTKLPTLDKVGTTYPIVFMKGLQIVDINGNEVKDVEIVNKDKLKNAARKNVNNTNRTMMLVPVNTVDGKKKYVAYKTMALNEKGEAQAFDQDIETARLITAAHLRLSFGDDSTALKNGNVDMSIVQAKAIQQQIKDVYNIDIANFNSATELVKGMVIFNLDGKKATIDGKIDGKPVTSLMMKGLGSYTQNTSISQERKKAPLKISLVDGQYKVEKIADTYEEYLRSRLSTEIVHHNLGTKENPVWTAHMQPIIKVKPIVNEVVEPVQIGESETANDIKEEARELPVDDTDAKELLGETNPETSQEELDKINEAEQLLRDMGMLDSDESNEYLLPTLENTSILKKSLDNIGTLTLAQQRDVISQLLSYVARSYDASKTLSLADFKLVISERFTDDMDTKLNEVNSTIANLTIIQNSNPSQRITNVLNQLNKTVDIINTVKDNSDSFFNQAFLEGQKKGFIPSRVKTEDDLKQELLEGMEEEMYTKDFSKSSNEVIHKDKMSKKLRRLFATIDTGKKGFLGLPKHESYDVMYNTVSALIVSGLPTDPSFEAMMDKLELYKDAFPWLEKFITEMKKGDAEIKNGFTYNMYKYAAKAKFVIFTKHKDGVNSEVWNSNANNIKRKIKESWDNNFKRSDVTNGSTLNTKKLESLYNEYQSWGDEPWKQDHKVLRNWLSDFGITLSDNTWKDIVEGKMTIGNGNKKTTLAFDDLFFKSGRNRGDKLFNNLVTFAEQYKDGEQGKLDFIDNANLHPFKDMGSILKSIMSIEAEYNAELQPQTRRDGGKSVSEMIFPTFYFESMKKLIRDGQTDSKEYIKLLQSIPFSSNSLSLKLLLESPTFADIFNYAEVGLQSLDEQFKKTNPFGKIDQISPLDFMFHQRNQFQYMRTETLDEQVNGIDMRIATMATLTNSDKGRMMLKKTAVFDFFTGDNIQINDRGEFTLSQNVSEVMYDQLVMPELMRIVNHVDSNIKDYDKGAVRFNLIPGLNDITVKGVKAIDFLTESNDIEAFKELYFDEMTSFLRTTVIKEATKNVAETAEFIDGNVDMFNNKEYLSDTRTKGDPESKQMMAEIDFVLNSMISNMDTLQTVSGDPAMFYKSKANNELQKSKDLGVNLGKRMAMMIAPGNVLAESQDEQYVQLFLQDQEEVAQNVEEVIGWHYGKASLQEKFNDKTYQDLIDELRNKTISKTDLAQLKLKFDKVKDFLEIETTDAQEYTTLSEHLRVLNGAGRITDEKLKSIQEKRDNGEQLSKSDIELVLQPIKPVYTGDVIEPEIKNEKGEVIRSAKRRIMYIKSSSFPLIPELVRGTKLEPLMNKMEQVEKDSGMKVRASYQSANKVGAISTPVNPFNQESLDMADAVDPDTGLMSNALVLDRINFKIQQDVPFKSDYQNEDHVSMGTQIFKLLFGDGITNVEGFEYEGESITGQELKEEFFNVFSDIIGIQKINLLQSLGLNEDYTSNDPKVTAEAIQKLLIAEAEERGFSQNDIKSLTIEEKQISGQTKYHFKLPLWFSANSNKFESMLNAIVNNKIFKQKIPGNAFVVGSEAGLEIQEGAEIPNNIIKLGDYKGGELKGTEVLAPSKIKLNGKLINLFEKVNGNYKYLVETDNGLEIDSEMIDPSLFSNFVFRTPTSSHGSGSNIKIVGFLPDVMGDLMITPKNFITQMGQDFDVDKLTSYQFYHTMNNGRIEKLNESHKEKALDKVRREIDRLEQQGAMAGNVGNALTMLDQFLLDNGIADQEFIDTLSLEDSDLQEKYDKIEREYDLKLAKNKFIAVHNSVYNNKSAEVQTKINKVLSMEVAENQADGIADLTSSTQDESGFNILSPSYQMNKLISGSTGSAAIGIYAKGVTFNSMVQQNELPIILLEKNEDDIPVSKSITIGKLKSNGQLGLQKTLSIEGANNVEKSFARKIAEAQDERVNTATDNEKAQILGRVGITTLEAVAVDNLLSLLGIDTEVNEIKESEYDSNNPFHVTSIVDGKQVYATQYSIPYLLHSQPIVKEYFKRLKNGNAIIKDFDSELKDKIKEELLGGYQGRDNASSTFTGERLADEIANDNYVSDFQKEILIQYLDLMDTADNLKNLQEVVDMSNLGKSMWESKDKIDKFKKIVKNESFENVESLLGEFSKNGTLDIGDNMYFTPKTNQGVMVGTAISLNRNLFYDYFPYYDPYISRIMDNIIENSGNTGNEVAYQETVFQEMKKFITAASRNGIFLDTPTNERKALFMDTDDNTSLSSYIAKLFGEIDADYKQGTSLIQNNSLISSMSYEKGENGKPSLIKFDNTEITGSEDSFYDDFKELLIRDMPLPPRNDKPYSTRELAQELVAYSHLSGGIVREAVEFHRFIPIEYYDSIINPETNTTVTRSLQNYDTVLSNWDDRKRLQNFTKQFFQNNPQYATQLPSQFRKDNVTIQNGVLNINTPMDEYPAYISIKNSTKSKLKQDKWSMYVQIEGSTYKQVPVLGEFGMSEYDYNATDLSSVVTSKENIIKPVTKASPSVQVKPVANKKFVIEKNDTVLDVLSKISQLTDPRLSSVAQSLLDKFKDGSLDTKLVVDYNIPAAGFYNSDTNVLSVNPNKGNLAESFLHEFVHAVTVRELKPYLNESGTELNTNNAPKEVVELNILFNKYKKEIEKKYPEELKKFNARYKAWREGDKSIVFTTRETSLLYPTMNMKEFLAISLSNNKHFAEEAASMPYEKTGMSFQSKFAKIIDAILNKIQGLDNNLMSKIIDNSLNVIDVLNTNDYIEQEMTGEELDAMHREYESQTPPDIDFSENKPRITISYPELISLNRNINISSDELIKISNVNQNEIFEAPLNDYFNNVEKQYGKLAREYAELMEGEIYKADGDYLKNSNNEDLIKALKTDPLAEGLLMQEYAKLYLDKNKILTDNNQKSLFNDDGNISLLPDCI